MKKAKLLLGVFLSVVGLAGINVAFAGKIVVANDEWTLSNRGFELAPDAGTFATNVANWFTDGALGNFHAYSNNFGLTESSLEGAITGAGHTWSTGTAITFDLPTLSTFDGIFLAFDAADTDILIDYVEAGGNVYLAAGTSLAAPEAATWNPFLRYFGLEYESVYNGLTAVIAINSPHPIFSGVLQLYQGNGSDIVDLDLGDPRGQILISSSGHNLYAAFESASVVPEPSTLALLAFGLFGVGIIRRKKYHLNG